MKPSWSYFVQRRGITLTGLIAGGMSSYDELVTFCNQRSVECPSEEEFLKAWKAVNPPVASKPKSVRKRKVAPVPKAEEPAKKPVRRTRRKKAGT